MLKCMILYGLKGLSYMFKRNKILIILLPIVFTFIIIFFVNFSNQKTVLADYITLRLNPNTNHEVVALLNKGEKVTILLEKGDWYLIEHNHKHYYTPVKDLNQTTLNASNTIKDATISKSQVQVFENKELSQLYKLATNGTKTLLLYENNHAAQILLDNKLVWVPKDSITISTHHNHLTTSSQIIGETTFVTTEQFPSTDILKIKEPTRLRTSNADNSRSLQSFDKNDFLYYIDDVTNNFYHAKTTENMEGYLNAKHVEKVTAKQRIGVRAKSLEHATITLDAGHGGNDSGSVAPNDKTITEAKQTLETANVVKAKLEKLGAKVIMTRTDDKFVSLENRPLISQQNNSDVFISLHYDSSESAESLSGTSVHVLHYEDYLLAHLLEKALQTLPLKSHGVKQNNFLVLRENTLPSILLELGYMNNLTDVSTFKTEDYKNKVADAIISALEHYFMHAN